MAFNTLQFLFAFFPATLAVYYICPQKLKNIALFILSLIFYAWGGVAYTVFLLAVTAVNYISGIVIGKASGAAKKAVLVASVAANLITLGIFKYTDFVIENINIFLKQDIPLGKLILPLGMSFYIFRMISYNADVYCGRCSAERNIVYFGLYTSFFAYIMQGPIVRYADISKQLKSRTHGFDNFSDGVELVTFGLAKKVILADSIKGLWDYACGTEISQLTVLGAWLGAIAFTFMIYFDFSGYSDIAIGIGKMFGFDFKKNFDHPYNVTSVTDFWRKWHISLGTWFRDYVYIPLGGNRRGKLIQLLNILIVWTLTGMWHGASWNFAAWGLYYGVLLIIEKLFLLRLLEKAPKIIARIYVWLAIIIGWIFFAFEKLSDAGRYISVMFGNGAIFDNGSLYMLYGNAFLLILLMLFASGAAMKLYSSLSSDKGKRADKKKIWSVAIVAAVLLLSVAYMVNSTYSSFLYAKF